MKFFIATIFCLAFSISSAFAQVAVIAHVVRALGGIFRGGVIIIDFSLSHDPEYIGAV